MLPTAASPCPHALLLFVHWHWPVR